MLENFDMEWERMEKEYWKMREDNERFRKNWEKNVRAMGAAEFFGLDEEKVESPIIDNRYYHKSTIIISDCSSPDNIVADVEYREVVSPSGLFIENKEV